MSYRGEMDKRSARTCSNDAPQHKRGASYLREVHVVKLNGHAAPVAAPVTPTRRLLVGATVVAVARVQGRGGQGSAASCDEVDGVWGVHDVRLRIIR